MRIVTALLTFSVLSGAAHASSILVLAPGSGNPSAITLGASSTSPSIVAAGTDDPAATPSIVALGRTEPGVAYENVAAIDGEAQKPKPHRNIPPMVIRGGVVGDAFTRGSGLSSSPMPAGEAPSPAAETPSSPEGTTPTAEPQAAEAPSQPVGEPTAKIE